MKTVVAMMKESKKEVLLFRTVCTLMKIFLVKKFRIKREIQSLEEVRQSKQRYQNQFKQSTLTWNQVTFNSSLKTS